MAERRTDPPAKSPQEDSRPSRKLKPEQYELKIRWEKARQVLDVSPTGVRFDFDAPLKVGTKYPISLTAPGEIILTAEFKISLLRAVVAKKLHCRADVVRPGSQLCFVEASVEAETADGERKLVARASVTLAVLGADHHAARSAAGRR